MINLDQSIRIYDDTGRNPTYQIVDILFSNDDIIVANLEHPDFDEIIHLMIDRETRVVTSKNLPFYLAENYEEKIKQYVLNGGKLFTVTLIDTIRDGGTKLIKTNKEIEFYVHMINNTIHSSYPPTDDNKIQDDLLIEYLLDRIHKYIENLDLTLTRHKQLLVDLDNAQKYKDLPF